MFEMITSPRGRVDRIERVEAVPAAASTGGRVELDGCRIQPTGFDPSRTPTSSS